MIDTTLTESQPVPLKEDRLPFLDGLRGLAAVWVIASHSLDFTGANIKYIHRGDIAVDLFMILSGFLMAYHYYMREDKEPWHKPSTWKKFYIRRFFRIAPLYYVLLFVFCVIGPVMGGWRIELERQLPGVHHTDPIRFFDQSLTNILMHLSFLFGFSKEFVVRTPMPDWSVTLEMQFYLLFPFLMLLFRRYYFVLAVPALYAVSYQINAFLYHDGFMKPSILPMSMVYFMMGMLLALFNRYRDDRLKGACALALTFWLAWLTQERFVIALALLFTLLLNPKTVGKPFQFISQLLGSRFSTWLADMSYGAYLIHFGFMTPIALACSQSPAFRAFPGAMRFAVVFVLTLIPTYLASMVMFNFIEKNGILWGKKLLKSFDDKSEVTYRWRDKNSGLYGGGDLDGERDQRLPQPGRNLG